jgi:hypothetical protein
MVAIALSPIEKLSSWPRPTLHGRRGQQWLAGAFASCRASNPSTLSAMKRTCQRQTTGFDLLERRMISLVPHVGRGEDDLGAPDVFLRRAAVRNNRLKAAAIRRRQFLLSCRELELLRRFGNRSNESDH